MKLGYACINTSLKTKFRTCRWATYEAEGNEKIKEISLYNLQLVKKILKWNVQNGIFFFRISSELVPFGSKEEMTWKWWEDVELLSITNEIKKIIEKHNMRISAHPGQYTVLNSPKEEIVKNGIRDLEYHDKMLELIGGKDMILHVGGAYGDKEEAKRRFVKIYKTLNESIRKKLRLENDDKVFNAKDVLEISEACGVPVCFDIHHHNCNPCEGEVKAIFSDIYKTWKGYGTPKTHISTGKTGKTDRSHHDYVSREDYETFLDIIGEHDVDIMFESKTKDLSVLKILEG